MRFVLLLAGVLATTSLSAESEAIRNGRLPDGQWEFCRGTLEVQSRGKPHFVSLLGPNAAPPMDVFVEQEAAELVAAENASSGRPVARHTRVSWRGRIARRRLEIFAHTTQQTAAPIAEPPAPALLRRALSAPLAPSTKDAVALSTRAPDPVTRHPAFRQALQTLDELWFCVPREPVGIGATWRVRRVVDLPWHPAVEDEWTFRLVAVRAFEFDLAATRVLRGGARPIAPHGEDGVTVSGQLHGLNGEGTAQLTLRRADGAPVRAKVETRWQTDLRVTTAVSLVGRRTSRTRELAVTYRTRTRLAPRR